jgi:DNA-binding CsgD family transcriptional regulator/phage shock protein PspC (stress-responsive transcriptional regulator)
LFCIAWGANEVPPIFYESSLLFILGAYFLRYIAIALAFGEKFQKKTYILGVIVIVSLVSLWAWCRVIGAPLSSLETIILLPLGVASGLTAKYQWDKKIHLKSYAMRWISYLLWFECLVFGALELGALAGIGEAYIHPQTNLTNMIALLAFALQMLLHILWVIYSGSESQNIFKTIISSEFDLGSKVSKISSPVKRVKEKGGEESPRSKSSSSLNNPNATRLTSKELEILRLVVAGQKNKVIADQLQISEASVKVHKSRMTSKLGVKTLPELAQALLTLEVKNEELSVLKPTSEPVINSQDPEPHSI